MSTVLPLPYSLESECPVPWSDLQTSNLRTDYPLSVVDETEQGFVIRRYLETLWLPESISPLSHLVHSLRRTQHVLSTHGTDVHSLHHLLTPLLLSPRAAHEKYFSELPQILSDGGGAGEQEETMMWYAWNYEKTDGVGEGDGTKGAESEERWRRRWLERLERREVMVQILLLLLKLSLSGPSPTLNYSSSSPPVPPSKKRKRSGRKEDTTAETAEERLELYMDKLSMWHLIASLDEQIPDAHKSANFLSGGKGKQKDDRHWTITFCEDVVQPLFKAALPSPYALLRSKLVPRSPFDDDTENSPSSPDSRSSTRTLKRTNSSASEMRYDSVSSGRSLSRGGSVGPDVAGEGLSRVRSRSLSVSLAEDEHQQRRSVVEPRRMLSREVSMSRVFKDKERHAKDNVKDTSRPPPVRTTSTSAIRKASLGITLVADTPVKRQTVPTRDPIPSSTSPAPASGSPSSSRSLVLVQDTPVRKRSSSRQLQQSTPTRNQPHRSTDFENDGYQDEDDCFTDSFGSPDVLLLGGAGDVCDLEIGSPIDMLDKLEPLDTIPIDTPTRKRSKS